MFKFRPLIGDMVDSLKDIKEGKPFYRGRIENIGLYKDCDLRIRFEGSVPFINLISNKSIEEFLKLQSHLIDRGNHKKGVARFGDKSFLFAPSTK